MFSIWERKRLIRYDFIIVGGGLVGMHTAHLLRKRFKKASICILERGVLPAGASTKNAGFACMGSLSELNADRAIMDDEKIVQLYLLRKQGLTMTRRLFGDQAIDYREEGSYELITKATQHHLDYLDYFNELLYPHLGYHPYTVDDTIIGKNGFNAGKITHAVEHHGEGSIDTGKLIKNMLLLMKQKNIEIKTGALVDSYTTDGCGYTVQVRDAASGLVPFTCQRLILCTNAFTRAFLPLEDIVPGRGQVLVTKPILSLPFKGIYHMDDGYYYFRNYKNRILFGGGRHKDFEGETTSDFGKNTKVLADLKRKLSTVILPNTDYEIDYSWSGIMAFGQEKYPIVKRVSEYLYIAARGGGMGVALSAVMAQELVALMEEG